MVVIRFCHRFDRRYRCTSVVGVWEICGMMGGGENGSGDTRGVRGDNI